MSEVKHTPLPCPFCGGDGDIESQPSYSQAANTYYRYRGWCNTCGFGLDWHSYEADAIEAWNRRVPVNSNGDLGLGPSGFDPSRGTFACPICGKAEPHHHRATVVDAYQNKRARR